MSARSASPPSPLTVHYTLFFCKLQLVLSAGRGVYRPVSCVFSAPGGEKSFIKKKAAHTGVFSGAGSCFQNIRPRILWQKGKVPGRESGCGNALNSPDGKNALFKIAAAVVCTAAADDYFPLCSSSTTARADQRSSSSSPGSWAQKTSRQWASESWMTRYPSSGGR